MFATRILTSSIVGLCVFGSALVAGVTLGQAFAASMPFMLTAMGGFCLNDVCDFTKDSVNKPYRAIPSGRLTKAGAQTLALILLAASVTMTALADLSLSQKALHLLVLIGIVTYNWVVRRAAVIKGLYTAVFATIPFVFVSLSWSPTVVSIGFPIAVMVFMAGRELLMDVVDVPGDEADKIRTLPMAIGTGWAKMLAFSLLLGGVLSLGLWARGAVSSRVSDLVVASTILVLLLSGSWLVCAKRSFRRAVNTALWVPMLLGIGAFVVSLSGGRG
jgi:geranylgeranylglycerol-phosphate geranylgeranyltransferase